jgi:hypothetical protein
LFFRKPSKKLLCLVNSKSPYGLVIPPFLERVLTWPGYLYPVVFNFFDMLPKGLVLRYAPESFEAGKANLYKGCAKEDPLRCAIEGSANAANIAKIRS